MPNDQYSRNNVMVTKQFNSSPISARDYRPNGTRKDASRRGTPSKPRGPAVITRNVDGDETIPQSRPRSRLDLLEDKLDALAKQLTSREEQVETLRREFYTVSALTMSLSDGPIRDYSASESSVPDDDNIWSRLWRGARRCVQTMMSNYQEVERRGKQVIADLKKKIDELEATRVDMLRREELRQEKFKALEESMDKDLERRKQDLERQLDTSVSAKQTFPLPKPSSIVSKVASTVSKVAPKPASTAVTSNPTSAKPAKPAKPAPSTPSLPPKSAVHAHKVAPTLTPTPSPTPSSPSKRSPPDSPELQTPPSKLMRLNEPLTLKDYVEIRHQGDRGEGPSADWWWEELQRAKGKGDEPLSRYLSDCYVRESDRQESWI